MKFEIKGLFLKAILLSAIFMAGPAKSISSDFPLKEKEIDPSLNSSDLKPVRSKLTANFEDFMRQIQKEEKPSTGNFPKNTGVQENKKKKIKHFLTETLNLNLPLNSLEKDKENSSNVSNNGFQTPFLNENFAIGAQIAADKEIQGKNANRNLNLDELFPKIKRIKYAHDLTSQHNYSQNSQPQHFFSHISQTSLLKNDDQKSVPKAPAELAEDSQENKKPLPFIEELPKAAPSAESPRILATQEQLESQQRALTSAKENLRALISSYELAFEKVQALKRKEALARRILDSSSLEYKTDYSRFLKRISAAAAKKKSLEGELAKNKALNQELLSRVEQLKTKAAFVQAQISALADKKAGVLAIDRLLESQTRELNGKQKEYEDRLKTLGEEKKHLSSQKATLEAEKSALEQSKAVLQKQAEDLQGKQSTTKFLSSEVESKKKETAEDAAQILEAKKSYKAKLEELVGKIKTLEELKKGFYAKLADLNGKKSSFEFQQRKVNEKQLLLDKKAKILEIRESDLAQKQRICQDKSRNRFLKKYDEKINNENNHKAKNLKSKDKEKSDGKKQILPRFENKEGLRNKPLTIFEDPYFKQGSLFNSK